MSVCSLPACSRPSISRFALVPRRVADPISPDLARGLFWPNIATLVFTEVCGEHRQAIKDAAQTVIAEAPLSAAEPAVRVVKDGEN